MNTLPSSIEESLKDAGFSATEILILRRLIEDRSLTLRQLAAKTGKSTGVLDQAMKKLLRRNVVTKENINENPVYTLVSLEAITRALEEDIEEKREVLKRRFENFESFVHSLEFDKSRPDTEYFEDADGLKRCYSKLLGFGKEIIGYIPVREREEDDPLHAFAGEFFRERRRRNIFSRIIAHDTPAGRKYQGRDAFEYRKTLLVTEEDCPFSFEKLIIGDAVACINHDAQRGCIIHFPELAQTERALFETLWRQKSEIVAPSSPKEQSTPSPMIPLKIRLYSELREFFTQPKNWAFLVLAAVVSVGVGWGLQQYTQGLNLQRVRDQVRSIAATATLTLDANDIERVRDAEDIHKPEYARLVYQLNEVRRQNPEVQYAYIFRKSAEPGTLLFVADADSIDPYAQKDLNGDGVIDDADALNGPGDAYRLEGEMSFLEGFNHPVADAAPYTDQWGTFISGAAPIFDKDGDVVAIIGVDIFANRVRELTRGSSLPIGIAIGLFAYLLVFRLASAKRDVTSDIVRTLGRKKRLALLAVLSLCVLLGITVLLWLYNSSRNFAQLQDRAKNIAITAATQFSPVDIAALRQESDWQKPAWDRVVGQLETIRNENATVFFAYIVRKNAADPSTLLFVADSHSRNPYANTDADPTNDVDVDGNGKIDTVDILQWPGQMYPDPPHDIWSGFSEPTTSAGFYEDSWGKFLSGYAPIKDRQGRTIAVFAVDIAPQELSALNITTFLPFFAVALAISILFILRAAREEGAILRLIGALCLQRNVLLGACLFMMAVFWLTFGWYFYQLSVKREEIGRRLMAIAASSTNRFDPADLDQLHWAADMRKPAYQRVQQELLRIREANPDVRYAYILRDLQHQNGLYEFVADADSQYFLPWLEDSNVDGDINEEDEDVAPGIVYFASAQNNAVLLRALQEPAFEKQFATDQWGTFIEGAAPIMKNKYILVFDMEAEKILQSKRVFIGIMLIQIVVMTFIFLKMVFSHPEYLARRINAPKAKRSLGAD